MLLRVLNLIICFNFLSNFVYKFQIFTITISCDVLLISRSSVKYSINFYTKHYRRGVNAVKQSLCIEWERESENEGDWYEFWRNCRVLPPEINKMANVTSRWLLFMSFFSVANWKKLEVDCELCFSLRYRDTEFEYL